MKKYKSILIILLILLLAVPSAAQMVIGTGGGPPVTYSSDLCSGGTAFLVSHFQTPETALPAFDDNETTIGNDYNTGVSPRSALGYHFTSPHAVCRIRIKPTIPQYFTGVFLKNFYIKASNDGTNYDTIAQRVTVNNENWQTFDFTNSTPYSYWKVEVIDIWDPSGYNNYIYVYEIEMMEIVP